jgi:DNA mismatch repair protein MutS2
MAELEKERDKLKAEERRAVQSARDEIVREAAELHKEIRQAAADLRKEKSRSGVENARRSLSRIREQLESDTWKPPAVAAPEEESAVIKTGDTVLIKDTGLNALVLSISEEDQEVEVQAGRMKMRLGLSSVAKVTPAGKPIPAPVKVPPARRAPLELDLRGKRADEVEPVLDAYLNDAAQSNIQEARIIHGYATGTVRSIVREYLKSHPLAKSFRPGGPNEGGDGVTVVRL